MGKYRDQYCSALRQTKGLRLRLIRLLISSPSVRWTFPQLPFRDANSPSQCEIACRHCIGTVSSFDITTQRHTHMGVGRFETLMYRLLQIASLLMALLAITTERKRNIASKYAFKKTHEFLLTRFTPTVLSPG